MDAESAPPAVGDVGALIDVLSAPRLPSRFVVEMSGADGVTVWLGEFDADKLEPARRG
ncbi:MAG TPA: hypothetical protein VE913_07565 [Longimicrobium sp.]|nr:hypothetical protein [Longimicrobium sp.]